MTYPLSPRQRKALLAPYWRMVVRHAERVGGLVRGPGGDWTHRSGLVVQRVPHAGWRVVASGEVHSEEVPAVLAALLIRDVWLS